MAACIHSNRVPDYRSETILSTPCTRGDREAELVGSAPHYEGETRNHE